MALRQIRLSGDRILTKKCREITEMTPAIRELIDDMFETMREERGVGLAAPQVGMLKRLCVIDIGEDPHVLINPELISSEGEQTGDEGCLSVPGKVGTVTRPQKVMVKALNEEMEEITLEGEDLLARAICHEMDHLDGIVYTEKAVGPLRDVEDPDEEEEEEEEA